MIEQRWHSFRARLSAATPGPWKAQHRYFQASDDDDEEGGLGWEIEGPPGPQLRGQFSRAADAHLIAHAPEDLAALLDVVDAAKAAMDHGRVDLWKRLDAALAELEKEVPR